MERRYQIVPSRKFDKTSHKMAKRGKDIEKMIGVINMLASGQRLPAKYQDHNLVDDKKYKNCRECHIESDWLLVYRIEADELILLLIETGTHSDLF